MPQAFNLCKTTPQIDLPCLQEALGQHVFRLEVDTSSLLSYYCVPSPTASKLLTRACFLQVHHLMEKAGERRVGAGGTAGAGVIRQRINRERLQGSICPHSAAELSLCL